MIRVRVSAVLIDQAFRQGYSSRHLVVTNGLPATSYLMNCFMDRDWVVLEFFDPETGPDRDVAIQLTTLSCKGGS